MNSSQLHFSFDTLSDLGGGIVCEAFERAVARVVADCEDRPAVKTARTVTIKLNIKPVVDIDRESNRVFCSSVETSFEVSSSVPNSATRNFNMAVTAGRKWGRGLAFVPESPGNAKQSTLDGLSGDEADVREPTQPRKPK